MQAYDTNLSEEEMEYLLILVKKRKIKKIVIFSILGVLALLFIIITIMALVYQKSDFSVEIIERFPFTF